MKELRVCEGCPIKNTCQKFLKLGGIQSILLLPQEELEVVIEDVESHRTEVIELGKANKSCVFNVEDLAETAFSSLMIRMLSL
jgi:hypothetical protein